ncbi:hypothetical protein A6D68_003140 [Klebsiella pneumoniae]|nr:hypothetical protein A6D68_003140 [Klebsiella pneumoniae]
MGCAPDEYDDLISGTCSHLLNVMCDQDVQFFSGICTINKFIPW